MSSIPFLYFLAFAGLGSISDTSDDTEPADMDLPEEEPEQEAGQDFEVNDGDTLKGTVGDDALPYPKSLKPCLNSTRSTSMQVAAMILSRSRAATFMFGSTQTMGPRQTSLTATVRTLSSFTLPCPNSMLNRSKRKT